MSEDEQLPDNSEKFSMTPAFYDNSCWNCLNRGKNHADYCRAFPDGIPEEFITGKNKHLKSVPGDFGYIYKPDGREKE
jgi:elongation factor P hydroxylase